MKGWIDLFIQRILPDMGVPESAAPFVFALLVAILSLYAVMPFLLLFALRGIARARQALAVAEEKLERLAQRANETHSAVKEGLALIQERLAQPPVRFGPDTGAEKAAADGAAAGAQPGTIPEGQGMYNYCPGCKEIRFIKFFRCQTCGFHVPR